MSSFTRHIAKELVLYIGVALLIIGGGLLLSHIVYGDATCFIKKCVAPIAGFAGRAVTTKNAGLTVGVCTFVPTIVCWSADRTWKAARLWIGFAGMCQFFVFAAVASRFRAGSRLCRASFWPKS